MEKPTVTMPTIRSDRAYLMATESLTNEAEFPSSDFSLVVRLLKGRDGMSMLEGVSAVAESWPYLSMGNFSP